MINARGLFITGTGTGVGKTIVTGGLLYALRTRGKDAISMKPVQTGAVRTATGWDAPDLISHCTLGNLVPSDEERQHMNPYAYVPACSPHLAGRLAGAYPVIGVIEASFQRLAARHDLVLVEGAGGILVPLDEEKTMLDLMKVLALPIVLVAHAGLGTINHTLLSLYALRGAGLDVLGVVFNQPDPEEDTLIIEDNVHTVARLGAVEILGQVPRLPGLARNDATAWALLTEAISPLVARIGDSPS